MRILRFNVEKQRITKDETCDFSGLVAGSVGYLRAHFHFSEEWSSYTMRIARFWNNGVEHSAFIDSNNECEIPPEALTSEIFRVSVMGVDSSFRIETNKERIRQGVN